MTLPRPFHDPPTTLPRPFLVSLRTYKLVPAIERLAGSRSVAPGCMLTSRASPTDRRYGGFEISLTPSYVATVGVGWLEKGFAYVQANIRGGGEFGPRWHQAALKEKRHKAYEDFEAVARDLVARGITSHALLGCQGGSNGGLLVGNMLARSPELWGAIVCQVPLLDMRRFNKLLAGASWMGERTQSEAASPTPRAIAQTAKPEPETRRQRLLQSPNAR